MSGQEENIEELAFSLRIKCQELTSVDLVRDPKSLSNLLATINEYSQYGVDPYVRRNRQIELYKTNFQALPSTTTYHLSCYRDTMNKRSLYYAKKRYTEKLNVSSLSENHLE